MQVKQIGIRMKTKIKIRLAAEDEREEMADITRASYREYADSREPEFWAKYENETRKTILEDALLARLVALIDNRIVGSAIICAPYEWKIGKQIVKNPYPEMRLLAVLPEYRNFKIGAELISACEEWTRDQGFDYMTLHTTNLMQTAKAMYERRGYERYFDIDFSPSPDFVVFGYKKSTR